MIYTTGTIAGNGSTITGTGTNFTAAGSLIRVGCTLIAFTNPVQVLQITAVTNGTVLSVTPAISPAIAAGTKYAILLSDSLSVDGLAQDIAETFGMYQKYMGGFSDVMNGTGDVTITINGVQVTVPGQKSLAKKGANTDITSLGGLTTALSVAQGGTGGKTQSEARAGIGLGTSSTRNSAQDMVSPSSGEVLVVGSGGIGTNTLTKTVLDGIKGGGMYSAAAALGGIGDNASYLYMPCDGNTGYEIIMPTILATAPRMYLRTISTNAQYNGKICQVYTDFNTTKAADGTLKAASPIVSVFHDGRAETNDESEGCTVARQGVGVYLIEGCMGLNADAAWGGIDGGFDVPKDRNRQPLVWLDYEVNPDGSILVKTYHRTYPGAPVFARNEIDGFADGDPIDIPADQFISVRVEMPEGSIYNQKQLAAEKAMEEAQRIAAEEAARKATEEAQADSDQPQS